MTPASASGPYPHLLVASRWLAVLLLLCCGTTFAHVKWFAPYDLICPPRPLFAVVKGQYFGMFCGVMVLVMFATAYIDSALTRHGGKLNLWVKDATLWFEPNVFLLIRVGVFAFLVAVSVWGNVLLTPELKTDWGWVRWFQALLALLVLRERTAYLTSMGLAILYGCAVYLYGWFHLLDYPIFLGVAFYMFMMSRYGKSKAVLALTGLRVMTSITLLWAGMEKFAYPDWSFPLLLQRPSVAMGFEPEFFMVSAGFVEFTAAFLLLTVVLAARVASALLLFIFAAAVPEFGVVDAVGHSVIIIVLIVLMFSHNPIADKLDKQKSSTTITAARFVVIYFVAFAAEGLFFYAAHWAAFGT